MPLEKIMRHSAGKNSQQERSIFNNATHSWNHTFFWHSLSPQGDGLLQDALTKEIKAEVCEDRHPLRPSRSSTPTRKCSRLSSLGKATCAW